MEHIVQFGIGIDDEAIKQRVKESAYEDIINRLMKECKKELPRNGWSNRDIDWRTLVDRNIGEFLERNRDNIITEAAKMMTNRIYNSKKYREKVDSIFGEVEENG